MRAGAWRDPARWESLAFWSVALLTATSAAELAARGAGELCVGPAAAQIIFPSAAILAMLAAGRTDFTRGEDLEPVYLRETTFVKAAPGRAV